jgi:Flp pilus assembly protein TadG
VSTARDDSGVAAVGLAIAVIALLFMLFAA